MSNSTAKEMESSNTLFEDLWSMNWYSSFQADAQLHIAETRIGQSFWKPRLLQGIGLVNLYLGLHHRLDIWTALRGARISATLLQWSKIGKGVRSSSLVVTSSKQSSYDNQLRRTELSGTHAQSKANVKVRKEFPFRHSGLFQLRGYKSLCKKLSKTSEFGRVHVKKVGVPYEENPGNTVHTVLPELCYQMNGKTSCSKSEDDNKIFSSVLEEMPI